MKTTALFILVFTFSCKPFNRCYITTSVDYKYIISTRNYFHQDLLVRVLEFLKSNSIVIRMENFSKDSIQQDILVEFKKADSINVQSLLPFKNAIILKGSEPSRYFFIKSKEDGSNDTLYMKIGTKVILDKSIKSKRSLFVNYKYFR